MINLCKYTDSCITVSTDQITVYFSYKIPLAFRVRDKMLMICENVWGDRIRDDIIAISGGGTIQHKKLCADVFKYAIEKAWNKATIKSARNILLKNLTGKQKINIKEEAACQRTLKDLGGQLELF